METKPRDIREILEEERRRRAPKRLIWVAEEDPPDGQFSVGMEKEVALPDKETQRAGFDFPLAPELAALYPGKYKFFLGEKPVDAVTPAGEPAEAAKEEGAVATIPETLAPATTEEAQ